AMGVPRAGEQWGFPVPGGLSVVGFDDIESTALLNLSTGPQPLEQSGAEGARRLCALLRGATVRPLRQLLPLRLVQRGSSGVPSLARPVDSRPHPLPAGARRRAHDRGRSSPRAWRRAARVPVPPPT